MAASSLDQNPPNATRHITRGGSDWLWAVFAIMALATLGMVAWRWTRPRGTRLWHNIALVILTTSTVAYFAMASDLGATPVTTEFSRGNPGSTRQIWFVRYIQWFINFPLLLILLLYTSGLALSDILTTAFMSWVVVICGLVGALTVSRYKWGFFALGCAALFFIWSTLLGHGSRTTFNAGTGVRSGYMRGAGFVAFLTMLYPIVWGLSEGGNRISPNAEMIWYGILDLLLGPLFLYYFVWGLRAVDYGLFGLHSGKYSDGPFGTNVGGAGPYNGTGAGYGEKNRVGMGGAGVAPGATSMGPNTAARTGPGVGMNNGVGMNTNNANVV